MIKRMILSPGMTLTVLNDLRQITRISLSMTSDPSVCRQYKVTATSQFMKVLCYK